MACADSSMIPCTSIGASGTAIPCTGNGIYIQVPQLLAQRQWHMHAWVGRGPPALGRGPYDVSGAGLSLGNILCFAGRLMG